MGMAMLLPSREPAARGLVDEAGGVLDGKQECCRCGQDLHLSPNGSGWTVGSRVEQESWDSGEAMHSLRGGEVSRYPECQRPSDAT